MDRFEIQDINGMVGVDDGFFGTVVFSFNDDLDGLDVTHHVTVKVRVKVSSDAPIRDMQEALYRKAVEQLGRALQGSEGKTAQQLLSEDREIWDEQNKPFQFDPE